MTFDPVPLLERLVEAQVDFVVIGGIAGTAHGSAYVTTDLDIAYGRTPDNLKRLAKVLRDVHATLRGARPDLPFLLDAKTLAAGANITFDTDLGPFDILADPAGAPSYAKLRESAAVMDIGTARVPFAALDHLIRMKDATGRPRDRERSMEYRALADEIRKTK